MILIKEVRCKNFLSYGNAWTHLTLESHKATLVRGKNGHGKSAWMDLILYALYGKPYRNISKPQLINSVNGGHMLVEIDFSINGVEYKVVRGQKPNVFDIFKNNELIEQNAASRDYQDFLEKQILKVSEKTFKQIAVLGSASYVPFMQLGAGQRRELVESILDIEIFSKMSTILKDRMNSTKEEFNGIGHKLELKKSEVLAQKKLISVMQENTKSRVAEYDVEKIQLLTDLEHANDVLKSLEESMDILLASAPEDVAEQYDEAHDSVADINREINRIKKLVQSVEKMTTCPSCLQGVPHEHREKTKQSCDIEIARLNTSRASLEEKRTILEQRNSEHADHLKLVKVKHDQISTARKSISQLESAIRSINEKINSTLTNTSDIEQEQEKLKALGEAGMKLVERKNVLSEEKHIQDVAAQLLKDTGIKTAIVKEYLPILNQLINKYLAMFDFFVDFTLDESFNEVIKSRGRDIFSYSSFSEGEKRRIDFAILMAFRQLAALKNSAKTNVLIFDEIVDGAFDLEARGQFNDLISTIPNSNVIVISHADANTEAYDRVIQVEKRGDFSHYFIVE